MINVAKLKLADNRRDQETHYHKPVTGRGIHGILAGCHGEILILKVTDLEKEIHGLLTNYPFVPAEECTFGWN